MIFDPDHPRSRGEYWGVGSGSSCRVGSSPLSRGIPECLIWGTLLGRIIPALAGNTGHALLSVTAVGDHPRSRGEYWETRCLRRRRGGSSPLSRGIQTCDMVRSMRGRIIPALAGNTTSLVSAARSCADHPRSRGEYPSSPPGPAESRGSSPLSRGIHA